MYDLMLALWADRAAESTEAALDDERRWNDEYKGSLWCSVAVSSLIN